MKSQSGEGSEFSQLLIVMGYIAVKDFESIPDKVRVLNNLGFTNKQMAVICDTTEGTIAVQKVANKKTKKKKSR